MAAELLRRQLVDGVAHVVPCNPSVEGRLFRYTISRSIPDVRAGACSRYYPVELSEVLRTIRTTPGRYAIVGIPCFIKAVNLLRADIAFGDAWVEPYSSDGRRGTNVVIVRNAELGELVTVALGEGRLALREVGPGFIRRTQAAGLRHRREGLAYRLAWKPPAIVPVKRNLQMGAPLRMRRKLIYRTRYAISLWSGRIFHLAQVARSPKLYVWWARMALHLYQGVTYSRGAIGWLFDAVLRPGSR